MGRHLVAICAFCLVGGAPALPALTPSGGIAVIPRLRGMDHACGRRMKIPRLSDEDVKARLVKLPGWVLEDGKLHREYKFSGFPEAFGFMSTCALVAQKQDHHPEWSNVFDRVVVDLTTHDAGGISALDFALATEMEKAAGG
jgi:4a-hydroxytetrahydrobiopterin dehydratase